MIFFFNATVGKTDERRVLLHVLMCPCVPNYSREYHLNVLLLNAKKDAVTSKTNVFLVRALTDLPMGCLSIIASMSFSSSIIGTGFELVTARCWRSGLVS